MSRLAARAARKGWTRVEDSAVFTAPSPMAVSPAVSVIWTPPVGPILVRAFLIWEDSGDTLVANGAASIDIGFTGPPNALITTAAVVAFASIVGMNRNMNSTSVGGIVVTPASTLTGNAAARLLTASCNAGTGVTGTLRFSFEYRVL